MARRMKRRQMRGTSRQSSPYMYGTRHRRRSNGLGTAVAGSYIGNKLANGTNRKKYVQQPYQQQTMNEEQRVDSGYQIKKQKPSIFLILIVIIVVLVLFYFLFTEPVYDYYVNLLVNAFGVLLF